MKVILNTDLNNLGEEGDIVEVAAGYARNYLLPRKLASVHNRQSIAALEARKASIEKAKEEKRKQALSIKEKILALSMVVKVPAGENGKLFGSVSSSTIADELAKDSIIVERKKIEVPGHIIKNLGEFKIRIKLYGSEEAELKLSVQAETANAN